MRLIPALGSQEMQTAAASSYVHHIVDMLLQIRVRDQDFFKLVASFLKSNYQRTSPEFVEKLQALQRYHERRPNADGLFIIPTYIDGLIQILAAMYEQSQRALDFQRGAIVELLASKLICPRCRDNECFNNHRFVSYQLRYESDQVDVAVLSSNHQQIEGYACKINSQGIASPDCTNLTSLATHAQALDYDVHVGAVCFDNSNIVRQRLRKFPLTYPIRAYGLDNLQELEKSPFL